MLFHHRAEHEADQQRCGLKPELVAHIAEDREQHRHIDVEDVVVQRVHADRAEHQDGGVEVLIGHLQQLHPHADQRQVDDEQHEIADPHRGDEAPEQVGLGFHHAGAGLDALDDQRADHQRHDGVGGDAQGEQGDEAGLGGGVVGGFRAGNTFDGAEAELVPALRHLAFHHIAAEGSERGATTGQNAQEGANDRATQHRWCGAAELFLGQPQAADLVGQHRARFGAFEVQHDFGDAEHAHGDGHEADAVGQFRDAEGEALLAGLHIGADQAQRHAEDHHADGLHHRALGEHRGDDQAEQHEREVIGRAEAQRHLREQRAGSGDQDGAHGAGEKAANGGGGERGTGAAIAGHLVAFQRCHHR